MINISDSRYQHHADRKNHSSFFQSDNKKSSISEQISNFFIQNQGVNTSFNFFEQRLKNNLFFDNLCSGNVSLNHCHTLRSQDSQFLSKSYISSPDIQLSNPTPITDASLTQSELSSADAIQLSINHIGLLYNSQCCLNITATKKILLSLINKLCTTPFARAHDGYINLTDAQIASKAPDLFNARQVKRHINDLTNLGILNCAGVNGVRWIRSKKESNAEKFMPIIDVTDLKLTNTDRLVLSKLLDKGSFFFKAELGFVTEHNQMKKITSELYPASERSIRQAYKKFKDNGLISPILELSCYSQPLTFNKALTEQYIKIFNIRPSKKIKEIVSKQAVEKVLRSDPQSDIARSVAIDRANKQIHNRSSQSVRTKPMFACSSSKGELQSSWQQSLLNILKNAYVEYTQKALEVTKEQIYDLLIIQSVSENRPLAKKGINSYQLSANKGNDSVICWQKKVNPSLYINKQY